MSYKNTLTDGTERLRRIFYLCKSVLSVSLKNTLTNDKGKHRCIVYLCQSVLSVSHKLAGKTWEKLISILPMQCATQVKLNRNIIAGLKKNQPLSFANQFVKRHVLDEIKLFVSSGTEFEGQCKTDSLASLTN